jgi:hypothetical protein
VTPYPGTEKMQVPLQRDIGATRWVLRKGVSLVESKVYFGFEVAFFPGSAFLAVDAADGP